MQGHGNSGTASCSDAAMGTLSAVGVHAVRGARPLHVRIALPGKDHTSAVDIVLPVENPVVKQRQWFGGVLRW